MDKYRTGYKRFLAAIVDGILLMLPITIFTANFGINEDYVLILSLMSMLLPVIYSVGMHYQYGQTLGKMLVNVQVKDVSEQGELTFRQALLRDSVLIGLEIVGLVAVVLLTYSSSFTLGSLLENIINNAAFLWAVLELATMLTNEKRRAIHDFLAHTVVVKVEK